MVILNLRKHQTSSHYKIKDMGRGKLNMELISNERSRLTTYHKRKKGLTKKAREFNILCNVDACVIILGPKLGNRPVDVETWPADRNEVMRIINRYRTEGTERKKTQGLPDFFVNRKKKVSDDIAKVRKAYLEAKFPGWDNRLNSLPPEQLKVLDNALDDKIEAAKNRVLQLKGSQLIMEENRLAAIGSANHSGSGRDWANAMASTFANARRQKSAELEILNHQQQQQPFSYMKPLELHNLPSYYALDQVLHGQQMVPYIVNHVNNPYTRLLTGGEDFGQFGGVYGGNYPVFDPAIDMLGNTTNNNNNFPRAQLQPVPMSYYVQPNNSRQLMMPSYQQRQVPEMPNVAPPHLPSPQ
ncbi:hypothetical protein Tsubulata_034352 [Turnera subulata]|uniref:MADS-box domain-containing protein n=1 Tax=Turnera subulata TaxID=218843 RepID=A0A9Q0FL11_9ROSI|nr:hypothetical protein Tsubulata_034352 [Turnera subulata]